MSLRIAIRPRAVRDIYQAARGLARTSKRTARRFADEVYATLESLASSPEIGTLWESDGGNKAELRCWPVKRYKRYLIFYRSIGNGIDVMRVLHASRDIENLLAEED